MKWANFLHFYQPPTQKPYWVKRIARESYRPLFQGLRRYPSGRTVMNVSGILLEQFAALEPDLIDELRNLLKAGQIELTGSAKYHPLLPYLPEEERVRQIRLQEETLRKYFGDLWQPSGFFPPEMGFSREVAETVAKLGYKWIIVDEFSFPPDLGPIDYSKTYAVKGLPALRIYFRERRTSWFILSGQAGTGGLVLRDLGDRVHRNEYLLTAMDGETFGHHRPGLEQLLFEIYEADLLETALISDLPAHFPETVEVEPLPSTWALMSKDLEKKKPFSRWRDEDNAIHSLQWELTDLVLAAIRRADPSADGYPAARAEVDRALHSDQYWWASARPWWSIEMMERGAKELKDAVRMIPGATDADKNRAEELYRDILFTAFDWQREGKVDELARHEDEEMRQRSDAELPSLPPEEIEKMTVRLKREISALAANEEFERAAQLRDRVRELQSYAKKD